MKLQWPIVKNKPQKEVAKQVSIPSAPIIEALGRISPSFRNINSRAEYSKVFSEVSEVYSVIMYMARAFSNMKLKLFDVNQKGSSPLEIESHEILDRLSQPNPLNNWVDFLINYYVNKKVQGNSYIYKYSPSGFNNFKDSVLWVLPAQYTYVLPNVSRRLTAHWNANEKDEFVKGYSLFYNQVDFKSSPIWTPGQVMHVKEPNLMYNQTEFFFDLLNGMSPLETLSEPITNIRKAYEAQNVILQKRGALGVLSPKAVKDQVGTSIYTDRDKQKLQDQFDKYGLGKEDWQVIISNVGMDWQQMALPIKDLQLFEGIQSSMIAICNTYNFPILLLNYLQGATFSNVNELKKSLYQDNIIPEASAFVNQLSNFLELPERGLLLKPDFSHIPVLQEDAKVEAEKDKITIDTILSIQTAIWEGKLTIDEGRNILTNVLSFSEQEVEGMLVDSRNMQNNGNTNV
jgi:HK97 family phage portal protein